MRHLQAARESLKRDKMEFDPQVRVGLVIETPASVILSRELAEKVDFFHIDTNDLVQYALAVDRQNPRVNSYYNTRHPAVMRMIEMVIDAAHTAGIKVTVSGDMADDERMLGWFIRTGSGWIQCVGSQRSAVTTQDSQSGFGRAALLKIPCKGYYILEKQMNIFAAIVKFAFENERIKQIHLAF